MNIICECGQPVRFTVLPSGVTLETCELGHARSHRGRTVEDVARDEAAFAVRTVAAMPAVTNREPVHACAWIGCTGFAPMRRDLCAAHCDERRRTNQREAIRARREKRNEADRSHRRSTAP